MRRPNRFIKILVIFLLSTVLFFGINGMLDANSRSSRSANQSTVPTRTPTPVPVTPKPGESSPTPELSPEAQTETASSPTIDLVLTPEGGYLLTAVPCTEPPTVQALDTVNIRLGPGIDFELIGELVFLEVRPIVGRSEFVPWWLIELADKSNGWVIDEAVSVSGYIGNVPVADSDLAADATPSPQSTWAPTVEPQCTPLPTHTQTPPATNTPTKETVASPAVTDAATKSPAVAEAGETPAKEQVQPIPESAGATLTPSPKITDTTKVIGDQPVDDDTNSVSGDEGFNSNVLLFIGLGLILVGIVMYIGRRFIS
ncbi:MAG: hypothetical protein BMS9Abin02_1994 [Anaerolineae bacterium]|nr:MAG: hypothetical protein BMS9Abin02_1994 [Anaerolineae bacterium]